MTRAGNVNKLFYFDSKKKKSVKLYKRLTPELVQYSQLHNCTGIAWQPRIQVCVKNKIKIRPRQLLAQSPYSLKR